MLFKKGLSLSTQFILFSGLIVMIFVLTGSGIFLLWQRNNITSELNNKGKTISFFISQLSIDPFLYKDTLKLDNIVGEAVKEEEVVYAFLLDPNDKIITSTLSSVDFNDPVVKELVKPEYEPLNALEKLSHNSNIISIKTPVSDDTTTYGSIVIGLSKVRAIKSFNKIMWYILLFGIIIVLSLSVSIFFMFRYAAVIPIQRIIAFTVKIENGIFTDTLSVKGSNEIAALSTAVNSMATSIKDMILKITNITDTVFKVTTAIAAASHQVLSGADKQKIVVENTTSALEEVNASAQTIATNTSSLYEVTTDTASAVMELNVAIDAISKNATISHDESQETASSIEEMAASIKQISEYLQSLSVSSDETSTAISEMSSSVKEVGRNADDSVKLAETVSKNASEDGMKAVNIAMQGISEIKEIVTEISSVNKRLLQRSDAIGKIVKVIEDVADQTTLLAINAAILASKAGEHGKGFSVVANEIRDLADRTTASTNEIADLIGAVQKETHTSVAITEKGLQAVEKGSLLFNNVSNALNSIIKSSGTSTEMAKLIQKATAQEAAAINQIANATQNILEQINMITHATEEQTKGSKFIVAATEKMKTVSFQINNAAKEQVSGTGQISSSIENITHQSATIAEATQNQTSRSKEISTAMDKILTSSNELISTSKSLDTEINLLKNEAKSLKEVLQKFKI